MDGRDGRQDGGRGPHEAEAERLLAERLTDGPLEEADRGERVRASLPPKYEVRIQTEYDPIVEETKRYRSMARELDGRYDRFMFRKGRNESDGPADGRTDRTEDKRTEE
jgi:hypothetical protein